MGLFSRSISDSEWCDQVRNHYNYILVEDLPENYQEILQIDLKDDPNIEDNLVQKVSGCAFVVSSCKEAQNQLKRIPTPSSNGAQQARRDLLDSFKALIWSAEDAIKWANRGVNQGVYALTDNRSQTYKQRHIEWGTKGVDQLTRAINFIGKND